MSCAVAEFIGPVRALEINFAQAFHILLQLIEFLSPGEKGFRSSFILLPALENAQVHKGGWIVGPQQRRSS